MGNGKITNFTPSRDELKAELADLEGDYWIWTGMHAAALAISDEDVAWVEANQAIVNNRIRAICHLLIAGD